MAAASIAFNRFGIGARPDDTAPADPRAWVLDQLGRFQVAPPAIAATAGGERIAQDLVDYQREQRSLRQMRDAVPTTVATPAAIPPAVPPPAAPRTDAQRAARQDAGRAARQTYAAAVAARATAALASDTPFLERMTWFWSNHFAVSIDKLPLVALAGAFEFEAIRPHLLGSFGQMLSAVERHPAMLIYLDQAVSVGPDSALGQRAGARRRVGLNENLAREIMELHTLGVRSGYGQDDVTEFARALTGWTVAGIGGGPVGRQLEDAGAPGRFVFAGVVHQPGTRTVMGRAYRDTGVGQAQSILDDLAVHPATARHLATKLARHFAADDPPPAMIRRIEAAFLASHGDLPTVYRAIVASPEGWTPGPAKFRTPWEWTIASYRALGTREVAPGATVALMDQLGQPVWKPGQPVGYDDVAGSWAGPDALLRRVEAAARFAAKTPAATDPRALGRRLFPGTLSDSTQAALAGADSPGQGLALLLSSPEMMRR